MVVVDGLVRLVRLKQLPAVLEGEAAVTQPFHLGRRRTMRVMVVLHRAPAGMVACIALRRRAVRIEARV